MEYSFEASLKILSRTPEVLEKLLLGLSDDWTRQNEGSETWCVADVLGHLIVCEQTDFITRATLILSDSAEKILAPIDMQAQFAISKTKSVEQMLDMFSKARKSNIEKLVSFHITETSLNQTALHPKIGTVSLRNLLSTWVAHDLIHTAQIARVMAKQYKEATGPFIGYLRILQ